MNFPERNWAGLFLSLLTAFMWGTLPVALQLLVQVLDVNTITWTRFTFSAVFVAMVLQRRGQLPPLRSYSRWGGFLRDPAGFDPLFFRCTPREADLQV